MIIRESKDIVSEDGKTYKVSRYRYNAFDEGYYEGPRIKRGTKTSDYFWADSNSDIEDARIYNESVILDSYVLGDLIVGSELTKYTSWQVGNIIVDSRISNSSISGSHILKSSIDNIMTAGLVSYESSIYTSPTGKDKGGQVRAAFYSCIKNFQGNIDGIRGMDVIGIGTLTRDKTVNGDYIISCVFDYDEYGECELDGLFRSIAGKPKDDYSFIKGYLTNPGLYFRCYTDEQLKEEIKKYGDTIVKLISK